MVGGCVVHELEDLSGNGCDRVHLSRFLGEIQDLERLTEWRKGGPGGQRR